MPQFMSIHGAILIVHESEKMVTVAVPDTLGILKTSKALLVQVSVGSSI